MCEKQMMHGKIRDYPVLSAYNGYSNAGVSVSRFGNGEELVYLTFGLQRREGENLGGAINITQYITKEEATALRDKLTEILGMM